MKCVVSWKIASILCTYDFTQWIHEAAHFAAEMYSSSRCKSRTVVYAASAHETSSTKAALCYYLMKSVTFTDNILS